MTIAQTMLLGIHKEAIPNVSPVYNSEETGTKQALLSIFWYFHFASLVNRMQQICKIHSYTIYYWLKNDWK